MSKSHILPAPPKLPVQSPTHASLTMVTLFSLFFLRSLGDSSIDWLFWLDLMWNLNAKIEVTRALVIKWICNTVKCCHESFWWEKICFYAQTVRPSPIYSLAMHSCILYWCRILTKLNVFNLDLLMNNLARWLLVWRTQVNVRRSEPLGLGDSWFFSVFVQRSHRSMFLPEKNLTRKLLTEWALLCNPAQNVPIRALDRSVWRDSRRAERVLELGHPWHCGVLRGKFL